MLDRGIDQDEGRTAVAAVPVAQAVVRERTYGVPALVVGADEDLSDRVHAQREVGLVRNRRCVVVGGVAMCEPVLLEERYRLPEPKADGRFETTRRAPYARL